MYTHVCMYVCMCMYIYIYIYVYTHIYTYKHIVPDATPRYLRVDGRRAPMSSRKKRRESACRAAGNI